MCVEWDPQKAKTNLARHSVDYADAVLALEDISAVTAEDYGQAEERCVTIGMDCFGRILSGGSWGAVVLGSGLRY